MYDLCFDKKMGSLINCEVVRFDSSSFDANLLTFMSEFRVSSLSAAKFM